MQNFTDWLTGDLSASGRIWSALAPLFLLNLYFFLGFLAYLVRIRVHGRFRDAEMEARGASTLIGMRMRSYFAWIMRPVWSSFRVAGVPPNAVTTLSVFLASAAGVSIAVGRFSLGGWLYLFAGICDFIDGRLARATGVDGPAGAALDSVLDRYAESAVLVGLCWYYRESWILLAVLATLVGSFLVPYIRARGEGLGVDVKVGLMQRPERLITLGVAVAFSPIVEAIIVPNDPRPLHRLAVIGIVALAITTQLTAVRRLLFILAELRPTPALTWAKTIGKGGIGRNVIAALVATAFDFLAVIGLVSGFGIDPRLATGIGCAIGALINFFINRGWTFQSQGSPMVQAGRYAFVSASSAILNSGGVTVLLFLPSLDYRIAWVVVRAAVFVAWNYPLQRDYVFDENHDTEPQASPSPDLGPGRQAPA